MLLNPLYTAPLPAGFTSGTVEIKTPGTYVDQAGRVQQASYRFSINADGSLTSLQVGGASSIVGMGVGDRYNATDVNVVIELRVAGAPVPLRSTYTLAPADSGSGTLRLQQEKQTAPVIVTASVISNLTNQTALYVMGTENISIGATSLAVETFQPVAPASTAASVTAAATTGTNAGLASAGLLAQYQSATTAMPAAPTAQDLINYGVIAGYRTLANGAQQPVTWNRTTSTWQDSGAAREYQSSVVNTAYITTQQLQVDNTGATPVHTQLSAVTDNALRKRLQLTPGVYLLGGTLNRDYRSSIWGEEQSPGTTTLKASFTDGNPVVRNKVFTDAYVGNQKDSFFGVWLKDVEIKGTPVAGVPQAAVGIETQNSSQRMENVRVFGFAKGIQNLPQSNFLQVWNYLTVSGNGTNVEWPATTGGNANSGENITINGGFYGGAKGTCFTIQKGWSIRMFAPSIDYNQNVFQFVSDPTSGASTPNVSIFAPHIEDNSGNPFIQNNFGNGGGTVSIWGGVFLRMLPSGAQLPLTKANIIDPGCGPYQTVSLDKVRTADRIISAEWSTSQVNPAVLTLPIAQDNLSGITEVYWITVTHNPTAGAGSFFEMRGGISSNLTPLGTSSRPAGTVAGHTSLLSITVPPGQKWGAAGQNVTISVRRQGDS